MITRILSFSFITAIILGIGSLNSVANAADDEKTESKSTSPPSPTTPTGPTYITVGDIVGQVMKVDSSSVTVRVEWFTATPAKMPRNFGHWGRGTSGRNPQQMMQHQLQMQRQMMQARARAANSKPKEHHIDYTMDFASDAIARIKHLPPKPDENGKKVAYTALEVQQAKGNPILPGYKADLSEIKVGQYVEAHIVKLPNAKDKKDSMIVRWALILNDGHANNTAAITSNSSKKN